MRCATVLLLHLALLANSHSYDSNGRRLDHFGDWVEETLFYDGVRPTQNCLPSTKEPTWLMHRMREIKMTRDPTLLRVLVKDWRTHKINSAILLILLVDVLGYGSMVTLKTTTLHTTAESFKMLSINKEETHTQADLDMELWQSAAFEEYQKFSRDGNYTVAGFTFNRARSGLFLRPAPGDLEIMKFKGRSYLNMNDTIIPRLPTVTEALNSGWCGYNSQAGDIVTHCVEMPNRACYNLIGTPDECKVLLKGNNEYDAGIVEKMIVNASLPLAIVYTNWDEDRIFRDFPNKTLLFYLYEPDLLISSYKSHPIVRVDFENPSACNQDETDTLFPAGMSCDFSEGGVHKGMSKRVSVQFPDVAHLVRRFQLPGPEILNLSNKMAEGGLNASTVACEWVLQNEPVWRAWLQPSESVPNFMQYFPLAFTGASLLITTAWATYPMWGTKPEVGSAWVSLASWWKPQSTFGILYLLYKVVHFLMTNGFGAWRLCANGLRTTIKRGLAGKKRKDRRLNRLAQIVPSGSCSDLSSLHHNIKGQMSSRNRKLHERRVREMSMKKIEFENDEEVMYDRRSDVAASLVQGLFRNKGDMAAARIHRANMRARVAEGAQFAQASSWGIEGTSLQVAVVRSHFVAQQPLTLIVESVDGTAVEGRDYLLLEDRVYFDANETYKALRIELLYNGVSARADETRAWLPVRECKLRLRVADERELGGAVAVASKSRKSDRKVASESSTQSASARQESASRLIVGLRATCTLCIVDCDDWPSSESVEKGPDYIFWEYCWSTFNSNLTNELWWLFGVVYRFSAQIVLSPVLLMIFFDVAVPRHSFDWALLTCAAMLLVEVLVHLTSYWYPSSWMMGYNVAMNWLLAKWTSLPLHPLLDIDTQIRFRGMVQLIDGDFFNRNDYSVFTDIVKVAINLIFIVIAPPILFCVRGSPIPNYLEFNLDMLSFSLILSAQFFLIAVMWFLVGKVVPSKYVEEVKRWISLETKFVDELSQIFSNTMLHRSYRKQNLELEAVGKTMGDARNQRFTYIAVIDSNGRGFDWIMLFLVTLWRVAAPAFFALGWMNFAQLYMLFNYLSQGQALLSQLTDVRERLGVSKVVLQKLSRMLNEAKPQMRNAIAHSQLQLTYLRRAVKDRTTDVTGSINCYRVRYAMPQINTGGNDFQVAFEGRIPLGELVGFTSTPREERKANKAMLDAQNTIILDLIAGMRVPTDGAVIVPPHVNIGVVPSEPHFIANKTLLENLQYGCGNQVTEDTIWMLCVRLGLPENFFCSRGGTTPMAQINLVLTPLERQLVSVARSLLSFPEVLVVHDQGFLPPDAAAKIGLILQNYADGLALTRLGERSAVTNRASAENAAGAAIQAHLKANLIQDGEVSETRPSCASIVPMGARTTSVASLLGATSDVADRAERIKRADRRTVIWHADQRTLEAAGLAKDRHYEVVDGQLHRVTSTKVEGGTSPNLRQMSRFRSTCELAAHVHGSPAVARPPPSHTTPSSTAETSTSSTPLVQLARSRAAEHAAAEAAPPDNKAVVNEMETALREVEAATRAGDSPAPKGLATRLQNTPYGGG